MSPEIEVVGQILGQPSKLLECDLTPADFSSNYLRDIFRELLEMQAEKIAIDPISVSDRLKQKTGQDWLVTVAEVEQKAFCHSTFQNQIDAVKRDGAITQVAQKIEFALHQLRESKDIRFCDQLITDLLQIQTSKKSNTHTLAESVKRALATLEELHETEGLPGVPTGLSRLDDAIGGYRKTNLVVIGARPAMGKTAFLLNTAIAGLSAGAVGFISAEQDNEQLAQRLFSIVGNIDSQKIRTARLHDNDWTKLSACVHRLKDFNFHINDQSGIDIRTICRQARDWSYKYDIKALYVDYIQKIKAAHDYQSKNYAVGEIVGSLKNLARELKIPVIALAQVNRESEKRPDKRPYMGDLADSSEIEKEADEIITLYRDEVYNPDTTQKGIAELLVCKARHGKTGVVYARWNGPLMQFTDFDDRF